VPLVSLGGAGTAAEHTAAWWEPGLGMRLGGQQAVRKGIDG